METATVTDDKMTQPPPANPTAAAVLVVDDDEANRDVLARRLRRAGYVVETASDGAQALTVMQQKEFDAVLLDVMMPGMSGLEVLQRVRKERSAMQLPIIMATARDQSADIVAALEMGANDYVSKPLDFAVVMARLKTQVSLRQSVNRMMELERQLSARNIELASANRQLRQAAKKTAAELEAAAKVQQALLPSTAASTETMGIAWALRPCEQLAGDALNVIRLNEQCVAIYILDVSGHGVAAALLAVAATRFLSVAGTDSLLMRAGRPVAPAEVVTGLNERLPWDDETCQFLTLIYGLIDLKERTLTYVSAGHPDAICMPRNQPPMVLKGSGMPIGVGDRFDQEKVQLSPGDRVYLYSDGVTEAMNSQRELFGVQRLMSVLHRNAGATLQQNIEQVLQSVESWQAKSQGRDDISILAIELS